MALLTGTVASAVTTITSTELDTLSDTDLTAFPAVARISSFAGNRKIVIAFPASFGDLLDIKTIPPTYTQLPEYTEGTVTNYVFGSEPAEDYTYYLLTTADSFSDLGGVGTNLQLQLIGQNGVTQLALVAAGTNSFLGSGSDQMGPCRLVFDSLSASGGVDIGPTESTTINLKDQIQDTNNDREGTAASNTFLTGREVMVSAIIVQNTLERFMSISQAVTVTRDANNNITRVAIASPVGSDLRSLSKVLSATRIINGAFSTDPLQQMHFFKAAPYMEAEVVYDATSQRKYNVMFKTYPDFTRLDTLNRPLYAGIGPVGSFPIT